MDDNSTLISLILEEMDWQRKLNEDAPSFSPDFNTAFRAAGHKVLLPDSCYNKRWMNAIRAEMTRKGLLPKKGITKKIAINAKGGTWHDRYDHY
jgi:hypothetical protein